MVNNERRSRWHEQASRRWRGASWIVGDGPFAVVAHCRTVSVSLEETLEAARKQKQLIDTSACGGQCCKDHEIVDLRQRRRNDAEQEAFRKIRRVWMGA